MRSCIQKSNIYFHPVHGSLSTSSLGFSDVGCALSEPHLEVCFPAVHTRATAESAADVLSIGVSRGVCGRVGLVVRGEKLYGSAATHRLIYLEPRKVGAEAHALYSFVYTTNNHLEPSEVSPAQPSAEKPIMFDSVEKFSSR